MRYHSGFALVLLLGVAAFPPRARSDADRPAAQGAGAVREAGAGTGTPSAPPRGEYRLQVGDLLEFRFPYSHELDFASPIRPDGRVFFAYIGDIEIGGLSVTEAHDRLVSRYRGVLRDPEVFILLKDYRRPQVYVAGEVPHPGKVDYYPGMSVHGAIFGAGGYTDGATQKQAAIIRRAPPDSVRLMIVGLARRGRTAEDLKLEPEDIVIVPKSAIANLDKIVRQYTRDLLPVSSIGVLFRAFDTAAVTVGAAP